MTDSSPCKGKEKRNFIRTKESAFKLLKLEERELG